jgi:lipoate-protein ligase A
MKLYDLGKVPWEESQLLYHALAHLGWESMVFLSPATPYVCIGYHQDVAHEIDLDYCKKNHIPVFRREVGGGAVYLDGNQLFFQLILREDNPVIPASRETFYRKFLQPVLHVYRRIGIDAQYKPVNDVIVGTKKISGTGVGEIGDCVVFVGNLILDFNYGQMARVLKVPDEKFRDKVQKTMEGNLTTIRRELGAAKSDLWNEGTLNRMMSEEFARLLGDFTHSEKEPALVDKMETLRPKMVNDSWLYRNRSHFSERAVKIRAGVSVMHRVHKAPGGLLRADFQLVGGRLASVSLSGDFFCYPGDAMDLLEAMLEGAVMENVERVVADFCSRKDIEIPGVDFQDWIRVLG